MNEWMDIFNPGPTNSYGVQLIQLKIMLPRVVQQESFSMSPHPFTKTKEKRKKRKKKTLHANQIATQCVKRILWASFPYSKF
jgi:hypothetical protein